MLLLNARAHSITRERVACSLSCCLSLLGSIICHSQAYTLMFPDRLSFFFLFSAPTRCSQYCSTNHALESTKDFTITHSQTHQATTSVLLSTGHIKARIIAEKIPVKVETAMDKHSEIGGRNRFSA
jgi:hypothetical protein